MSLKWVCTNFCNRLDFNFKTFSCLQNDFGQKRENITVGVGPAPAKFDGYKYINNVVYTDWIVKSYQTLTELQILYRNNEVSEAMDVWIEIYGLITIYLIEWMETEKRSHYEPRDGRG